jgi:hypothetical protein
MEFVDNTEGEKGCRPKSAERIRATLDAVHEARENPPSPGQRTGGLEFNDWVAVSSESGHVSPRRLVRLLRLNDIEARQVRRGDDVIVEVFAGRHEEALELLERHRPNLRIPRGYSSRREVIRQYLHEASLGGFVGAVVGLLPMLVLMLILDEVLRPRSSSAGAAVFSAVLAIGWGAFILVGAIVAIWRYSRKRV